MLHDKLKSLNLKSDERKLKRKSKNLKSRKHSSRMSDLKDLKKVWRIPLEEVKKGGGVNSNTFWDVRRKLCGRPDEKAHAMMNKDGVMCEKVDEIKEIHADWFKELLTIEIGKIGKFVSFSQGCKTFGLATNSISFFTTKLGVYGLLEIRTLEGASFS